MPHIFLKCNSIPEESSYQVIVQLIANDAIIASTGILYHQDLGGIVALLDILHLTFNFKDKGLFSLVN
jgi:hypothetical protein